MACLHIHPICGRIRRGRLVDLATWDRRAWLACSCQDEKPNPYPAYYGNNTPNHSGDLGRVVNEHFARMSRLHRQPPPTLDPLEQPRPPPAPKLIGSRRGVVTGHHPALSTYKRLEHKMPWLEPPDFREDKKIHKKPVINLRFTDLI